MASSTNPAALMMLLNAAVVAVSKLPALAPASVRSAINCVTSGANCADSLSLRVPKALESVSRSVPIWASCATSISERTIPSASACLPISPIALPLSRSSGSSLVASEAIASM